MVTLALRDTLDLGAEFFRWEFATAVAGVLLGIHPFNQPNVQLAKAATERILSQYAGGQPMPRVETSGTLADLLGQAVPGGYLAIMAYLQPSPETDQAFTELRRRVVRDFKIATTFGYGPRFLHSTGQLHNGGPETGLFLQITTAHQPDLPIPGQPYTFATVVMAQSLGDLQALQSLGRNVVSLHLEPVDADHLQGLAQNLK